jgi:hypothetical protein
MITLAALKSELGFGHDDTKYDPDLIRISSYVVDMVRQETGREIAWRVSGIATKATGTADLLCIGHGLQGGETILIAGSDSTPSVDGEYEVTVLDENRLRVTFANAITKEGTTAVLHVERSHKWPIRNSLSQWIPQFATPFYAIKSLKVWNRDGWVLIDPADYELGGDTRTRKSVVLNWTGEGTATTDGSGNAYYVGHGWPMKRSYPRGQYGLRTVSQENTMWMTCWAGLRVIPAALQQAMESMVLDMFENQGGPKDIASVSEEGVSSTRMSGAERAEHMLSPQHIISAWQARV